MDTCVFMETCPEARTEHRSAIPWTPQPEPAGAGNPGSCLHRKGRTCGETCRFDGEWERSGGSYTTIGSRKICVDANECDAFKVIITSSRGRAEIEKIAAY